MKQLAIIFLCLNLGACSFGSTAYKYFDFIVLWYASDYVSLEKEQKALLTKASKEFIEWHKANELSKYQALLDAFKQDIKQQSITPSKADEYRQEVRLLLSNIRHYLEPNLAPLLAQLSDKQYQQVAKNLRKQVSHSQQEETSIESRLEQIIENTEQWYGPLNEAQLAIIKKVNLKRQRQISRWQAQDQDWLASFDIGIEQVGEERVEMIKDLLLKSLTPSNNSEYSEKEDWFAVWQLANAKQRGAIIKKLNTYQELLNDITED